MTFIELILLFVLLCAALFATVSVVGFLTATRWPRAKGAGSKNSILEPVRKRFAAENLRGNRLGEINVFRPALVFDYGRTMARLRHFGTPWRKHSKWTVLETELPVPSGQQVSVMSRGDSNGPSQQSDMETGDPAFDREFLVETNAPALAKQLLTDSVRWKMAEIKTLQTGQVRFDLAAGFLKIGCQQWFASGPQLLDFVQEGLALFDQLMLFNAEGVEFTREGQAAVMEDFRCPICNDDVMSDMVVCKRCKTPHCAECWEYNGKCGMFACMEERCVPVQQQEAS